MKLTISTITAIITFLATASVVAKSGGGFKEDCKDIQLEKVDYTKCDDDGVECPILSYFKVWANCTALDDKLYNNELNLNLCLVNDHGKMQWRRRLEFTQYPLNLSANTFVSPSRGKFDNSCEECSLVKANKRKVEMTCYCHDGVNEKLRMDTIDLNQNIELKGNTIWCGDEIGIAHA
ncbi:uncharacterized protein BDZ83DRAFT_654708 [Colletotrichum acutatum]|uniref:Cyanovirin-N domain-containing protein n=1 Tax=Glomerella acutata TaxID=27357 RepID=A0AAD8XE97_GLOAC|nr:uncharacterized protein BDZ83DRAFT_654708 [Colletotrichum acutatum]KAK1719514.1 hypothetical protein BDZ83DRAFT_654708 [Colletotrichum acutatum]